MKLSTVAKELRLATYRAISDSGDGHFGGNLSAIEIITALYFHAMNVCASDPRMHTRDRLVVSKGHAGPVVYAALAMLEFFPLERLQELNAPGGIYSKHINRKVPGVDFSAGALGQGLSVGVGMALGMRLDQLPARVYVLLGDGECDEGQVWEAAMAAGSYGLSNLTVIVDRNRLQTDGATEDIVALEPFADKWASFGFRTLTADGHDVSALCRALDQAKLEQEKPCVIIANTIKGKGVSFMENDHTWHAGRITKEQYAKGLSDLEGIL